MRQVEIEDIELFPILIQRISNFLTPEQCKDICDYFREHRKGFHDISLLTSGVSTWEFDSESHKEITKNIPSCDTFTNDMVNVIMEYASMLGVKMYCTQDIVTSWVSIQNVGSVHKRHKHTGSQIAGVIYLNVDERSNHITFYNPNEFPSFAPLSILNKYNLEKQTFKPELGTLYLFPAWLGHGSDDMINGTPDRTIFSFNTF